ncbi:anthrone oxygenase family protein [Micromonospora sp. NPDC048930]|uniref:anthrone oxygenase family protein n=1 Tax=Micromonospora sp. NPDC048930 TaxID=3364261 RepID=UPI003721C187
MTRPAQATADAAAVTRDDGRDGARRRLVTAVALFSTGLLTGAFGYGALNVVQAFQAVPLEVRLTFHVALMRMNGPVMQSLMGLSVLSLAVLAVLSRGTARRLTAVAATLVLASFVVTRFGNVPINAKIKVWAVEGAPPDHAAILHRWEIFNNVRTGAALLAFVLLLVVVTVRRRGRP